MPVQIDMEMPRSCGDCRFCRTEVFGCVYCDAYGNYGKEISPCTKLQLFAGRKDWCPLAETEEQKWHVVADGDLPPKPKDGIKRYLVTKQRQNDWSKRIVTALYWDGNDFYNDGLSGSRIRYVLAWRELLEPCKGANNE